MRRTREFIARTVVILCVVAPNFSAAQQQSAAPQPEKPNRAEAPAARPVVRKEDWGILAVDPAALLPLSSAVIGNGEFPGFTREVLRVQWRAGDPIDLFVIKPRGVEKPPVALYLYGYPNDTTRFWDDGWCKRATEGGMAAVGFVSALTGQRYANRPMKQWFISELPESLGSSSHDVQMILNYLGTRSDLSASQVAMFGQGSGGSIAILAAAVDPRIVVVDVLDPWGDWPEWLKSSPEIPDDERAAYLQPEFLKSVASLDPVVYLPHLKLKALRVQQVMDEAITPPAAKQRMATAVANPAQSVSYKDERAHLEVWRVRGLSGWMRDQMTTSASATGVARP